VVGAKRTIDASQSVGSGRRGQDGRARVIWIADLLPNEAASMLAQAMEQGIGVMKKTLDALAEKNAEKNEENRAVLLEPLSPQG